MVGNNSEIWKNIPDYLNYQISNLGRAKSKRKILKPYINKKNGYLYYQLTKKTKTKLILAHRLVAQAFIPNPDNLPCINHKDENRHNNIVSNLEWCSYSYNLNYGKRCEKYRKKVNQYDLNGNFIKTWNSLKEAQLFYKTTHILDCCKRKRNKAKGYKWSYYDR